MTDIVNAIGQAFSMLSNSLSYPESFKNKKRLAESQNISFKSSNNEHYNCRFTEIELLRSLQQTSSSSPGHDGITYTLLKKLSHSTLLNILYLFNRIWQENYFPTSWTKAIVIPFQKPGKDPKDPKNYRPIALTSCLCKLLERMVNNRLVYILETNEVIAPFQSGFRRGRSTSDNIITLETHIRNAFLRNNHLVSIFFDIEKAYDRTWRHGILKDLHDLNFRGHLPIFIKNFLNFRLFQVRMGSTLSDFYTQEEGVPQGSVLSVTLFSIKINNILNQLPSSVQGCLYVDDLQISCQGKDMRFIERQLQTAVNRINNWSADNGFNFSIGKTNCINFTRRRGLCPDPEIFLNNTKIRIV
jgi:hypothetical protein